MAFYKKMQIALNKKWYPRSILVGKPISTEQVARRLAAESTVAPADVMAVLQALSGVMGDYMAQGRSVQLDGIGYFYFSSDSHGNGVDTPEKVSVNQINGVKVRFTPEISFQRAGTRGKVGVRPLTDVDIEWIDIDTLAKDAVIDGDPSDPDTPGGGTDTPGGGGDDGDTVE